MGRWTPPADLAAPTPLRREPAAPRRSAIMACLLAAMAMVALEATVVATAVPQIVAKLGGGPLYGWIFSAFLLVQAVSTPLWGRLSDLHGRKKVLAAGLGLFLSGSLLCGFAPGMRLLVAARVVQGLGAGCVQPLCTTLVGDLYEGEARTRAQGWLSSIWGPSALIAPALGALLIQTVGWPWVFWINLLPGAAALAGVLLFLPDGVGGSQGRESGAPTPLDLRGALVFAVLAAASLLTLGQVGAVMEGRWLWAAAFALVVAVSAPAFLAIEGRAAEPVIPLRLWTRPVIAGANAVTLVGCMALMGVTALLPLYVQGVMGRPPLLAGFTLTTMAVGWPIAAVWARSLHNRAGIRMTLVLGGLCLTAGSALFCLLAPDRSIVLAFSGSFVAGMGMGLLTMTGIVVIQAQTQAAERGSATSSNIFSRALGGALGAALLSALVSTGGARMGALKAPGLHGSLHTAFLVVFGTAVVTLALTAVVRIGPRPAPGPDRLSGATD